MDGGCIGESSINIKTLGTDCVEGYCVVIRSFNFLSGWVSRPWFDLVFDFDGQKKDILVVIKIKTVYCRFKFDDEVFTHYIFLLLQQ